MKTLSISPRMFLFIVAAGILSLLVAGIQRGDIAAQEASSANPGSSPVEKDMHEFMEYVFQPTYLRLKAQMTAEPADNQAWKAIKSDSLILAEGGNLLLIRQPDDNAKSWAQLSVQVRDLGGQLYQAAKKKDFKSARQQYEAMLNKCNACHQQFADGEHQLAP